MELNHQRNPSNKHHTFGLKFDPPPQKTKVHLMIPLNSFKPSKIYKKRVPPQKKKELAWRNSETPCLRLRNYDMPAPRQTTIEKSRRNSWDAYFGQVQWCRGVVGCCMSCSVDGSEIRSCCLGCQLYQSHFLLYFIQFMKCSTYMYHQPPLQDTVRMPTVHLGRSHRVGLKKNMDQKTGISSRKNATCSLNHVWVPSIEWMLW